MKGILTPVAVRVVEVYDDGQDTRHFTFESLSGALDTTVQAGQFFMLTVPRYGEAAFTYVSLPDASGRFSALIRKMGQLTGALFELPEGAVLGHRGPFGRGWPMQELKGKRVLILAGGCGLAPLSPALEGLTRTEMRSRVALVYGARAPEMQVLARERTRWQRHVTVCETFDVPGEGVTRLGTPLAHVDAMVSSLGGEPEVVLACGPEVMLEAIGRSFEQRGLGASRVWLSIERRMHCGVGLCGHCYLGSTYVCKEGPTYRWDELKELNARSWHQSAGEAFIANC